MKSRQSELFSEFFQSSWSLGLLLVLAVVFAYQPVWHAGFVWDDDKYVIGNPLLTAKDGLWRIWFSTDAPSQYFPLTYTVFRLEHALWRFNSTGYHLFNIFLHAMNALLVWQLLQRLTVPGAWLAAAIFALHPVQVESVAWVAELKNVLMCFFFLLTLLCWIEFLEKPKPWRWYALALFFYALALCSKTTACTLPAAALLILWLKQKPIHWQRLLQIVPFIAMGIGMGLLTMWWEQNHQHTEGKLFSLGFNERLLVASHAIWFYLGKLFWPANLIFSYPKWTINPHDLFAYGWLLALIGLGAAICFGRRFFGRSVETGLLFYIVTLSPMLGFIMLYTMRMTYVADHYQYVACIGLIALIAAGINIVSEKIGWLFRFIVGGAILFSLAALTWCQCHAYADKETLWRTTIAKNPESWIAYGNLAAILSSQGKTNEAIADWQEALKINPDAPEFQYDLAVALLNKGDIDKAISLFENNLEDNPAFAEFYNSFGVALFRAGRIDEAIANYEKALSLNPGFAQACNNLATALLQKGQTDKATAELDEALAINPDFDEAHYNLGNILLQRGETDAAIAEFQKTIAINPNYFEAYNNLGAAFAKIGKMDEAVESYQKLLQLVPNNASAHDNLGLVLFRSGKLDDAITQYQAALKIQPDYPECYSNLGLALFKKGKKEEAIAAANRALPLANEQNKAALAVTIQAQIKLFQAQP